MSEQFACRDFWEREFNIKQITHQSSSENVNFPAVKVRSLITSLLQ